MCRQYGVCKILSEQKKDTSSVTVNGTYDEVVASTSLSGNVHDKQIYEEEYEMPLQMTGPVYDSTYADIGPFNEVSVYCNLIKHVL